LVLESFLDRRGCFRVVFLGVFWAEDDEREWLVPLLEELPPIELESGVLDG
jgi:hypothetical protein